MRKHIAVLLCLALAAGLLVSCGTAKGSRPLNVQLSDSQQSDGSAGNQSAGTEDPDTQSADAQSPGTQSADAQTGSKGSVAYPDRDLSKEQKEQESFAAIATTALVMGARISGVPGSYKFSYKHPEVPEKLHFSVSLRIYEEGAEGDILRESYDSDAAWLTQDGAYDPSEREVEVPLKTAASLSGMYVLVSAKCFGDSISTYSAAAIHDYDGTESGGFEGVFAWER